MKLRSLAAFLAIAATVSSVYAIDGKAAVAITRQLTPYYGPQPDNPGRLLVATVSGTNVTSVDTILRGGPFFQPTWSFDGKRIAFYRRPGGGVSVIDADGGNLRTVANTMDWTLWGGEDLEHQICWPGADDGKWIYYHAPCEGCYRQSSGEIWKVNVDDTAQKVLVCDFKINDFQSADGWGGSLRRFQLSADAKYCAVHAAVREEELGYQGGIIPFTWPPQYKPGTTQIDPGLTEPECTGAVCYYRGDCNSALSTSGSVLYHLRGGHCQLYAHYWDHDDNTIGDFWPIGTGGAGTLDQFLDVEVWMNNDPRVGGVFIYPRGIANSDKLVTMLCGYQYGDLYSAACGTNQIVVNWKDKEAVFTTNIPRAAGSSSGNVPEGTYFWLTEPSDFWASGGPEGCYEDLDGNWIPVTSTTEANRAGIGKAVRQSGLRGTVAVYDLKGARVGTFDAQALSHGVPARLENRIYVVSGKGELSGRLNVAPQF